MVIRQRVVELSAELVPDSILAVFASRDDHVICGVPIAG